MKKVLALALMLVLALGSMAMAQVNNPPTGGPTGNNVLKPNMYNETLTINAIVDVAEFVHISELDPTDIVWDLYAPASIEGESYNEIRAFKFATNTPVRVTLSEDIAAIFGNTNGAIITGAELFKFANFSVDQPVIYGQNGFGGSASYIFPAGEHSGELNAYINWRGLGDWWEVAPREGATGTISILIEASQP